MKLAAWVGVIDLKRINPDIWAGAIDLKGSKCFDTNWDVYGNSEETSKVGLRVGGACFVRGPDRC
jgi:hypothetical protein